MITENLSNLTIHKLTQKQYNRELESGSIDPNALYLTPDEVQNNMCYKGSEKYYTFLSAIEKKEIGDTWYIQDDECFYLWDGTDWKALAAGGAGDAGGGSGSDSITPHIGDNGNWFIGEEDTGVRAQGERGASGVYVGSGDMPEDCNVQIDSDGEALVYNPDTKTDAMTLPVGVDENGKLWAEGGNGGDVPTGGGSEVCDLLIDVTTTERVSQVKQDIDNVAYKELYVVAEAQGHTDNSVSGYRLALDIENKDGEIVSIELPLIINNGTNRTYAKTKVSLTDKIVFGDGQSNTHTMNGVAMTTQRLGIMFFEWDTNIIKSLTFNSRAHTMETGAKLRVWGVRA